MKTQELTEVINNKIQDLQTEVNQLPGGGGVEILRVRLQEIRQGLKEFIARLDEIESR